MRAITILNQYKIPVFTILILLNIICLPSLAQAQKDKKESKDEKKAIMRDTLDNQLDFSRFLIDAHGFIPVPMIITEPALGGFGGLIAPVFITPKKIEGYDGYLPPDITAAMGMYTVNGSYGFGAFRLGSFPKKGIKYRLGILHANMNLDFYRTVPIIGEKKFNFNFVSTPFFFSVSKKILKEDVYLGVTYTFAKTKVNPLFAENLPPSISPKEFDTKISTIGLFTELDKRSSIFTPDYGYRLNIFYKFDADWTGSDYNFQKLEIPLSLFLQVNKKWVSGFRFEVDQIFNDPPFYLLPFIRLRGIPAARYQGRSVFVVETEQRFDLNTRWSVLGFVGYGKAIQKNQTFKEGANAYSVGTGFRYLIARSFNARAGIDIAFGPDSFGWYIVFGHNWNN